MSISDQGWAAISAYECANMASANIIHKLEKMFIDSQIKHLRIEHGLSIRKIAKRIGCKESYLKELIKIEI